MPHFLKFDPSKSPQGRLQICVQINDRALLPSVGGVGGGQNSRVNSMTLLLQLLICALCVSLCVFRGK